MKKKVIVFLSITIGILAALSVCMILTLINYPPGARAFTLYVQICMWLFVASINFYAGGQKIQVERRNGTKIVWYKQTQITCGLMYGMLGVFYIIVVVMERNLLNGSGAIFVYSSCLALGILIFIALILTVINVQEDTRKAQIAKRNAQSFVQQAELHKQQNTKE